VKVLSESDSRVILRRKDGAIIFLDDEGFSLKKLPGRDKEIKTTEWADWLLLNDALNKITRGNPKRR